MKMLKSSLAFTRILVKNSFSLNINTSKVWQSSAIQTYRCRYVSDDGRQLTIANTKQPQGDERKRKIVEAEVLLGYSTGQEIPDPATIQPSDWEHLFTLNTHSARKKYCRFLFLKDVAKKKQLEAKAIRKAEALEQRAKVIEEKKQNSHIYYGLGGNTLLMRIRPATIDKWLNRKLLRARLYGPKLIFDCSFDSTMSHQETKSAGRQLHYCFSKNRRHKNPFDIHLCNVNMNGQTLKWLQKHIPNILEKKHLMGIHEKCFTELFPAERLVYLSPDSENELTEYNADDIFIVGAIVDTGCCQPLSLARAKSLGVRHVRLPLDIYVRMAPGAKKRFTLDTMTKILLEWKESRNWKKAFKHIENKLAEPIE